MMEQVNTLDVSGFIYNRYVFSSQQLGRSTNFGILKPPGDQPIQGTLYFIHGGNGDDQQFIQENLFSHLSDKVKNLLKDKRIQIALPGIGLSFLKEDRINPTESYSDYFFNELIPAVELGTQTSSSSRILTGVSMGGHASLNAFMRKSSFFSANGAIFPGIANFNPFSESESQIYLEKTKISEQNLKVLLSCFFSAFRDQTEYFQHDPITLLKAMPPQTFRGKPIYLDVGTQDDFGLFEGTRVLSEILFSKDVSHKFELIADGLHDAAYVRSRITFMFEYLL
jgi:esterase/lipase superfamily enzyme